MIHGTSGVGGLQQRVAVVQRVALAVLLDRLALEVLPGLAPAGVRVAAARVLVDVVAEEHEGVDVTLLDEVAVGGVVALLPVLARREGETEPVGHRALGGEGPRACGRGGEVVEAEPVPVLRVGGEAARVDVDRVAECGDGWRGAARDHVGERFVGGDLPRDVDVVVGQRLGGEEPRPEDHRVRERVTRGDAERERIGRHRR